MLQEKSTTNRFVVCSTCEWHGCRNICRDIASRLCSQCIMDKISMSTPSRWRGNVVVYKCCFLENEPLSCLKWLSEPRTTTEQQQIVKIDNFTCERCLLVFFLLTTGPGHVSVSAKDITVNFDDSHCGSSPIAVTVECWCCPTVRLCVPTPHKPTTFFIDKDWVQIRKQYLQVLVVIKTSKYGGQTKAWGGKRKGKITVGQINETKALIGGVAFESKVDNFITPRLAR